MPRVPLLALAFLACFATAAAAATGGTNLAWGQCLPEGGLRNETFLCDVNTGSHVLVASFDPGIDISEVKGFTGIVDLCTNGLPLPDWWQLYVAGTCRESALSSSADFTSWPGLVCADAWAGTASGGIAAYEIATAWQMDAARIKVSYSLASPLPVYAGTEYYGFRVAISNVHTVGIGACSGCMAGACIVLNELRLIASDDSNVNLTSQLESYYTSWQHMFDDCPFLVPAKNRTWGSVKALYR